MGEKSKKIMKKMKIIEIMISTHVLGVTFHADCDSGLQIIPNLSVPDRTLTTFLFTFSFFGLQNVFYSFSWKRFLFVFIFWASRFRSFSCSAWGLGGQLGLRNVFYSFSKRCFFTFSRVQKFSARPGLRQQPSWGAQGPQNH